MLDAMEIVLWICVRSQGLGAARNRRLEAKRAFERFGTFTTLAMSSGIFDYAVRVLEEAPRK
jgi:hypothetical protein